MGESLVGMGLKIMKFRASNIGARLAIVPGSHGGTSCQSCALNWRNLHRSI